MGTGFSNGETMFKKTITAIRLHPALLILFTGVFLGVFLLVVITTTLVTFILPESFASTARVHLRAVSPGGGITSVTPTELATQLELLQSQVVLNKVIETLDLNEVWAKKFGVEVKLRTDETTELLKRQITVRPVRNTTLIEIRAFSEKPDEAAKLANTIAGVFAEFTASSSGGIQVQIVDAAVPSLAPVRPNKPLNIGLGVVIGTLLGLVLGAGSVGIALLIRQGSRITAVTQ